MISSMVVVPVALVSGSGRCCSRCWERSLLLLLLGAVVGALTVGNVRWWLLSLGEVVGDLVAGSGCCCSLR